ncbi:aspartic peptidase domain-containing protein, partial [Irpex lacteus]
MVCERGGRYAGFCMKDNKLDIDHEVPAESSMFSSEYVVPVKIDTGSSDLWIWSCELAESHHIYSPRHSETARQEEGSTWQISYGDGSSASGDVYEDVVSVAGVTIPHQSVECARELSSAFLADGGNDGLLGLGWPKLNTVEPDKVKTPMENMIEQGVIDQPIFTVMLGERDNLDSILS